MACGLGRCGVRLRGGGGKESVKEGVKEGVIEGVMGVPDERAHCSAN